MSQEMEQAQAAQVESAQGGDLLDEIIAASKLQPGDEGFAATRAGLQEFIRQLAGTAGSQQIASGMVDKMIEELDSKLSLQVNSIMHDKTFAKLESSWRSLKFLVDRTDFRQNIKLEFINVSKEDLLADFEDAPEVVKSGLYKTIYTAEYGQFGGKPVGAMIANYDFTPGPQDIQLLGYVASVASMAHAPFVAAVVLLGLVCVALAASIGAKDEDIHGVLLELVCNSHFSSLCRSLCQFLTKQDSKGKNC